MKEEGIRPYGVFTTIVLTIIGVGIFSYPRYICMAAGRDGWIVTIISGIMAGIMICVIYYIEKLNDFDSYVNIIFNSFGKFLGSIVITIFLVYAVVVICIYMRDFVEVLKIYLLENTPLEFLIITTLLLGVYIVGYGFDYIMKFNEIIFFIAFVPLILAFVFLITSVDFTNVLPIGQNSLYNYKIGIYRGILAFGGYEILFLAAPMAKKKDNIKKISILSIAFVTLFYALVTIYCLGLFSLGETENLLWPTITMITAVDIPGSFVERWEGIVMTLWILFHFSTFSSMLYFSCDILKDGFNVKTTRIAAIILCPIILIVTMYAKNIIHLHEISEKILNPLQLFNVIIVPILLLVINLIKHRGENNEE